MKKDKIKEVLNLMSDSINQSQIDLYNKLIVEKCYSNNIEDAEDFYMNLIYPHKQFINGLIRSEISNNNDIIFILTHSNYIEHHFTYWIQKIEGSACCADKTRTIIRRLVEFYKNNKPIEFDYTQEYTFHLPKVVFKTHDDIVNYYKAIKSLNYGNPTTYLNEIKKITEIIRNIE